MVLLVGLGVLTVGLVKQSWLSANPRRLRWFRNTYFVFTLGFIGWYAQGQLSVVNLTAAVEALLGGSGLGFFLTDPMTVLLWLYVAVTLLVWGRGTFCGWLCPFGALQDLLSQMTQALGLRHKRLRAATDERLKIIKYVVLGVVLATPWFAGTALAPWGDVALEVEPFKTAISLYFVRDWPYLVWLAACLGLSVVVYRGYCRYICPLGAALAAVNVLQRWQWIPRREACGTPCQTCRHACEFQAIAPSGHVDYSECFQCLDCVSIHQDDHRCLPLIRERKGRVIPIALSPAHAGSSLNVQGRA
jgi:polyferredoxin